MPRPLFTPGERTRGTCCTGGWVSPRAGLDTEVRVKISYLYCGSNLDRPVVQSVARHYSDCATQLQRRSKVFNYKSLPVLLSFTDVSKQFHTYSSRYALKYHKISMGYSAADNIQDCLRFEFLREVYVHIVRFFIVILCSLSCFCQGLRRTCKLQIQEKNKPWRWRR
jgi:hypothetical protein